MKTYDWIINGGGIKAIFCAYNLLKKGFKVAIIEGSSELGGVLASKKINDFYLDLGCHLFDNFDDSITKMMLDLANNDVAPVNVQYSSKIDNRISNGFAVPDFSIKNKRNHSIYNEIISLKNNNNNFSNYANFLEETYGPTASSILKKISKKILRIDPNDLDVQSMNILPLNRIVISDDEHSNYLKNSNTLIDKKIASSVKFHAHPKKFFSHRHFYPKSMGTLGFIKNAKKYLKSKGADIFTDEKIIDFEVNNECVIFRSESQKKFSSNYCFWTSNLDILEKKIGVSESLKDLIHNVPMVVYYFFLKKDMISKRTYTHNFDQDDLIFRSSCPGIYGNQFNGNDLTYVCFEVPIDRDSAIWKNPEKYSSQIWKEAINMQQVYGEEPKDIHILKTPVSFKPVKVGFSKRFQKFKLDIKKNYNNFFISNPALYSKIQIADEITQMIESL